VAFDKKRKRLKNSRLLFASIQANEKHKTQASFKTEKFKLRSLLVVPKNENKLHL